jgi:chromosome segregation ATPase
MIEIVNMAGEAWDRTNLTRELAEASAKLVTQADTITTLRAVFQKLNERNAEYIGTIDRLRRRVAETDVEIERLSEANEMMLTDIRRTDVDMLAFKAEIERLRAALDRAADRFFDAGMNDDWAKARAALSEEKA